MSEGRDGKVGVKCDYEMGRNAFRMWEVVGQEGEEENDVPVASLCM